MEIVRIISLVCLTSALVACGGVSEKVNDFMAAAESTAADQAADGLAAYCNVRGGNIDRRKSFLDAVNARGKPNAFAYDCDGDGKPDFKTEVEAAR